MAYDRAKLIAQVDLHLSANPRIHLGQLARILRVERHAVENIVRNAKGICFREYQKQLILNRALELLTGEAGMSIKQIAIALGYSPSSFTRFIRQETDMTPRETRVRLTKGSSVEFVGKN